MAETSALEAGKRALYSRDTRRALSELEAAVSASSGDSLPLAYRSLAKRVSGDAQGALEDAERAVALDSTSMEARLALCLARLTMGGMLAQALGDYHEASRRSARDLDGDVLLLTAFMLFFEPLASAEEDAEGMQLTIDTDNPLTHGAVCLTDGLFEEAASSFKKVGDPAFGSIARLGLGVAYYRMGNLEGAAAHLGHLIDTGGFLEAQDRKSLALRRLYAAVAPEQAAKLPPAPAGEGGSGGEPGLISRIWMALSKGGSYLLTLLGQKVPPKDG